MKKTNVKIKAGVFVVAALFLATTVTVNANSPLYPLNRDNIDNIGYIKHLDIYSDVSDVHATHIYVCDDTDAQGYEGSDSDGGFNDDNGEFTSGDYTKISVDDNNGVNDSDEDKDQYQYHQFNFTIDEDIADITQIDITWKGYGGVFNNDERVNYTYGHSFWVKDSSSWSEKDNGTSSSIETLTIQKTADFSDWIVDGHLECAAQSEYSTVIVGEPPLECIMETSFLHSCYVEVNVTYIPDYHVLWQRTWFNGDHIHGWAGKVAVDSQNNVITCGMDNYNNPVLIKYDTYGEEVWVIEPTPEGLVEPVDLATLDPDFDPTRAIYEMTPEQLKIFLDGINCTDLWDVVVDSEDNIISCGEMYNMETGSSVMVVVKHEPDGTQLWNTSYSYLQGENGRAIPTAIAIDSNDNIYVAGVGMLVLGGMAASANGVAMKVGKLCGIHHWVKIHSDTNPLVLRVYSGVDVDLDTDRVFFTGYKYTPATNAYTMVALELGKYFGWTLDEDYWENDFFAVAMVIDQEYDRIYIVGRTGGGFPGNGMIVKLDFSFNVVYESITPNDFFQDVAILDEGRIVLGTYKIGNQYTIGIHSKEDGSRLAKYKIGPVSETPYNDVFSTIGVAVDSNTDILASGGIGAIDTIKTRLINKWKYEMNSGQPDDAV